MPEFDVRCPNSPNRLFLKVVADGDKPVVTNGNLMELACSDCARARRKKGQGIFRVLHRYAINGELWETCIQYEDGTDELISGLED
jgi:hypothetical protein